MGNYVNETNTLINTYNNYLQKGDMATEDVIGIINKYISFLNNITSFLPLGQNKLATINTIDINTIASDCKDAQNKMIENQNKINQLTSQLDKVNKEFDDYKKSNNCETCPANDCKLCPAPKCPDNDCTKCQAKDCQVSEECKGLKFRLAISEKQLDAYRNNPLLGKDCSSQLDDLNYQVNNLKATKKQMDIIGVIIVSILALLLLWLIWTFLIEKKKLV